ncbi:uncharacterized protein LOC122651077 [Telopea speciosissima]|uniref:uncharacterized protein LOC122651077 n=1 Tax=Telopea speciosissima TaxID=54955 RepID=UPI001CC4E568|nr:uncharacterized protein LOC122651077 [Telopea speciosissima]
MGQAAGTPGNAGIGGVCRDNNSTFICGFSEGIGWNYALVAEALAARKALLIALDLNIRYVIIESYNLLLITLLNGESVNGGSVSVSWRISSILFDYFHIIPFFVDVKFFHVFREANFVANSLATLAADSSLAVVQTGTPANLSLSYSNFPNSS